jgi:Cdc6-like AAA superfamily ATPase
MNDIYIRNKKTYLSLKSLPEEDLSVKDSSPKETNLINEIKMEKYSEPFSEYLRNVHMNKEDANLKIFTKFQESLRVCISELYSEKYISNVSSGILDTDIYNIINEHTVKNDKNEWFECKDICFHTIKKLMETEMNSTAFILRALAGSIIGDNSTNYITFTADNVDSIKGIWNMDRFFIRILISGEDNDKKSGTLMMCFGPNASGKTHWTKKIISAVNQQYPEKKIPNKFISLDCSVYRKYSIVYQLVKRAIQDRGYKGILNMSSSFSNGNCLFDAERIKETIIQYLEDEKYKNGNNFPVNIYVPESLDNCDSSYIFGDNCFDRYERFIRLTGDEEWNALLIWQHRKRGECDLLDSMKCIGCLESSKFLEIKEGRKYEFSCWNTSMLNGNSALMKAPGLRLKIHSTGGNKYIYVGEDGKMLTKNCVPTIENL